VCAARSFDIGATDQAGRTALQLAKQKDHRQVVALLLQVCKLV